MAIDILKKYDETTKDYVPNNEPKPVVCDFEKHPLGVYNANNILLGFTWNKGDNVTLTIKDIDKMIASYLPDGMSIEEVYQRSQFVFKIYSTRGEELFSHVQPLAEEFSFEVADLDLVPNVYQMELKVELFAKQDNSLKPQPAQETHTLFSKDVYSLFIK